MDYYYTSSYILSSEESVSCVPFRTIMWRQFRSVPFRRIMRADHGDNFYTKHLVYEEDFITENKLQNSLTLKNGNWYSCFMTFWSNNEIVRFYKPKGKGFSPNSKTIFCKQIPNVLQFCFPFEQIAKNW